MKYALLYMLMTWHPLGVVTISKTQFVGAYPDEGACESMAVEKAFFAPKRVGSARPVYFCVELSKIRP